MRIILADHHPHTLWALKTMFQEKPEFKIVGEAVDSDGLLTLVAAKSPDLVLVDGELPGRPIVDLISEIHACKQSPIVAVMSSKPEYGNMMLKAGADVFISKSDQTDWLLETLLKYELRFKSSNK